MSEPNASQKSPRSAEEQDSPEPVRPTTPLEDEGMDVAQLDEPPKAEGSREDEGGDEAPERAVH